VRLLRTQAASPDNIPSLFYDLEMKNRWAAWTAAIVLWSALGVLFALPGLSSGNWRGILLGSLLQWWSWGLVTPLIFWIDKRLPFKGNQLGMRIFAHLLASVPLTALYFYVVIAMGAILGRVSWGMLAHPRSLVNLFADSLELAGLLGHIRCATDIPILRTLSRRRIAAGANGAQLFASAPECTAHAAGPAFPL
jgi:hypothetical protein